MDDGIGRLPGVEFLGAKKSGLVCVTPGMPRDHPMNLPRLVPTPPPTALVAQSSTPPLSRLVFSSSVQMHHNYCIVVNERPRALAMEPPSLLYIKPYE